MENDIYTADCYCNIDGKSAFIRYKSVIAELMIISQRIQLRYVDRAKLHRYGFRLADKLLNTRTSQSGHTQYCVLSKITKDGYEYKDPELLSQCSHIIAVEDEYGAVANELFTLIKNEAVSRKASVICCYNPFLQYSLERIILPDSGVAVCRESSFCKPPVFDKRIHASRFCDNALIKAHRQSLNFNNKIIKELLPNCHQNSK